MDRLGFSDGDQCCVADGEQGVAMEYDGDRLFDGGMSEHRDNGVADAQLFAAAKGLAVSDLECALYRDLSSLGESLDDDGVCDRRGCGAWGADDPQGLSGPFVGEVVGLGSGDRVIDAGSNHLFWARLDLCVISRVFAFI